MSFAPIKSGQRRNKSPEGHKKSATQLSDTPYSIQSRQKALIEPELQSRLDVLESHLSRVSNQQDALLPLMDMLDLGPSVAKNENLLKGLSMKNQDTDDRISRLEDALNSYKGSVESSLQKMSTTNKPVQFDSGLFERNLKMINNQVHDHEDTLKGLEDNFLEFQRAIEMKIDDETDNTMKIMESKLDNQKRDFTHAINELKKNINETLKKLDEALKDLYIRSEKYDEYIENNNKEKILEDIHELVSSKFQEQFEFFRDKYDKDIDDLYREYGIMRSEMDIMSHEKRQGKLSPHIQSLNKPDVLPCERKIKLNNAEQSLNIHELQKFNDDNTQRLIYELHAFEDKLDILRNKFIDYKSKVQSADKNADLNDDLSKLKFEMENVNEKYSNLKYQIEGAKKKYTVDMRKIEDKMEKLNIIKKEAQDELMGNAKLKRSVPQELQVIEEFPKQIHELIDSINVNLSTTFTRLELVEEKMKENQDLLRK